MTPAEAVRRASAQAAREVLEARLALALRANRIEHTREFSLPGRQFRWDFAFPQPRLFEDAKVGAGDTAVQGDMLLPANAEVTGFGRTEDR